MTDWVLPRYGRDTLADLLGSVAAHLGVPGHTWPAVDLPSARRYVVLLVDGLGHQLLARHLGDVDHLSELFGTAQRLTAGVPSTTATSLTCLGTGCAPGRHGVAGYAFRSPESGGVMNALTWEGGPEDVAGFQPVETVFEQAAAAGVAVTSVAPARFEASGLTRAALRGPDFVAMLDESDLALRIMETVRASRRGERSLVYVYERALDHAGHGKGVGSDRWLEVLRRVDLFTKLLREELDDDVVLLVTGDHGMVDIAQERMIMVEDEPGLLSGVDLFAGEGRLRQLYTSRADQVTRRWRSRLGERAWVVSREEAVDAGWFGPLDERVADRFGDVLVAMRTDWAVMTRALPRELTLVGQHGSLTEAEMAVPLLVDAGAH